MSMPEGILNLNKRPGPTSHDVVDHVRRLTGIRRVGHAGTLDPLAAGVLLVCIGRATRVAEYLMAGHKVYRARVRLGISTDTYDAEGMVTSEAPVEVSRDQVEAALSSFRGVIAQVPPVYSAIKHQGTPLHRLARRGVAMEQIPLKARQVEILRLELTAWEPPECTLDVTDPSGERQIPCGGRRYSGGVCRGRRSGPLGGTFAPHRCGPGPVQGAVRGRGRCATAVFWTADLFPVWRGGRRSVGPRLRAGSRIPGAGGL